MSYQSILQSPIGTVYIQSLTGEYINAISFSGDDLVNEVEITMLAKQQLTEYFNGTRLFFDFPIAQTGTDFQKNVWVKLMEISIGKPISYTTLSKQLNNPLAIRAIAAANGKNTLLIVIPCHRVIGSKGELVGYAGELWRKKWLLEHEARLTGTGQTSLSF